MFDLSSFLLHLYLRNISTSLDRCMTFCFVLELEVFNTKQTDEEHRQTDRQTAYNVNYHCFLIFIFYYSIYLYVSPRIS